MNKIDILGIKISKINRQKSLDKIEEFLLSKEANYVVTPNPEIILAAIHDEELLHILNSADLALPDGFGLKLAALLDGKMISRVTGADMVRDILALAEKKNIKVAILNWKKGLSSKQDIDRAIKDQYPKLDFLSENVNREPKELSGDFKEFKPKIVFVNFGAPYQEKFIYHKLRQADGVRVALGIGGAFDFITGRAKRAPKILRFIGLEWLWRLVKDPKRLGRIYQAVVVFPYKVIRNKFLRPFLYRPNVACFLYKKDKGTYKVLVVERSDEPGHWQIPQGGRDGQNLMDAGTRELCEEIGCEKFIPKRAYKNVHRYKFGTRKGESSCRADSCRKHTGFKGQKQGLFIAEFIGKDEDIQVNFWDHEKWKWVDSEKLVDEVEMVRKRATQRFVRCFEDYIKTEH
ncbi:WecB/TagA/CpsF family glycosyltransferase [Candidatus Falkowbacteria bacterium]|nr:WecB/TagA/CpsF family glycosyltransferase [Candidatus Falkowbacteria bacterium]